MNLPAPKPAAKPVALYALTPQGARQALRVCAALGEQAHRGQKDKNNHAQTMQPSVQAAEADPEVTLCPQSNSITKNFRTQNTHTKNTHKDAIKDILKNVCLKDASFKDVSFKDIDVKDVGLLSGCTAPVTNHVYVPESLHLAPDLAASGIFRPFSRLSSLVEETFHQYRAHIFIAATGIAVRTIAPLLEHKQSDPAVLVMDQKGQFVISLVSGHLGGANALTAAIAAALGATPVITTATDLENVPAIDSLAVAQGLVISNIAAVKKISAALVAGETVPLYDPDNWLALAGSDQAACFQFLDTCPDDTEPLCAEPLCIVVTTQTPAQPDVAAIVQIPQGQIPPVLPGTGRLILHPPALVAGIGCKRNTPAEDILKQLSATFQQAGQSLASLCCLASASVKQDESGLCEAARILGVPLRFFPLDQLRDFPVTSPSARCEAEFAVKGVCEPAALAAAGDSATLVKPKTAGHMVTVAIAQKKPGLSCTKLARPSTPL